MEIMVVITEDPHRPKLGVVGVMGVNEEAMGVEVIITDRNLQKKIMCVR